MMEQAYLTSSRYEYMFWTMAYNLEDNGPPEFGHNRFPGDSVADNANDARSNAMARRFTGTVNAPDFPVPALDWLNTERPVDACRFQRQGARPRFLDLLLN